MTWFRIDEQMPPENIVMSVRLPNKDEVLGVYHGSGVWNIWEYDVWEEWTDCQGAVTHWKQEDECQH